MSRLSLRAQITCSVVFLVLVVVALAGFFIALRIEHQDRAQVDAQLRARAAKVSIDATKSGSPDSIRSDDNQAPNGGDSTLLAGTDAITRILENGRIVIQRGDGIPGTQVVPAREGLSTVRVGGQAWRSLVEPTASVAGGRIQLLQSLAPVEQRLSETRRLIAVVATLAALMSGVGAWIVAGLVLRPLDRLRRGAVKIRALDETEERLPGVGGPQEIAELSVTLNHMLERLQASMRATRRFTADAGHEIRTPLTSLGMDIETLRRNPQLSADRQTEMLEAMTREHARVVAVLDGLQQLARGDARVVPESHTLDVAEIAADAVAMARIRHPVVDFRVRTETACIIDGWPDGVRLAIANLLDNAARHGRPGGTVDVSVTAVDGFVRTTVDDDGEGILADQRGEVVKRFARGVAARGPGSGLGLALVEQQAEIHEGRLTLGESPAGGLRATLSIPRRGA